ncbi:MAG TPA: cytochrome c [Woeseiaceae bacterium]|nr:cytochrome c [Woeseiaceae bacterium]
MRLCSHHSPERAIAKPIAWLLVACLPLACAADQTTAAGNEAATTESAAGATEGATEDAAEDASASGKFYDVDCNQVDESGNKICVTDKGTYVGWRTFHATCHACHGQNAVGSSFAPSLLTHIDKARFVDVVTNGFSGQIGVMPAWGENPNVKDFIDELYAYQQARADGVLKPGRPERKD